MADMENQEDQKISECLQEAFGYSDEQLLKKLDHVNENFKDVSFAGAETPDNCPEIPWRHL